MWGERIALPLFETTDVDFSAKNVGMMPMATCDAYGYVCSFFRAAAAPAKGVVFVFKNLCCCAKMAVYTVRITGWALKRKS